jgi:hypothetical protein
MTISIWLELLAMVSLTAPGWLGLEAGVCGLALVEAGALASGLALVEVDGRGCVSGLLAGGGVACGAPPQAASIRTAPSAMASLDLITLSSLGAVTAASAGPRLRIS